MAGIANLGINIDARGAIQKLRDFTRSARDAAAAATGISRSAQAASGGMGELAAAAGKLAAAYFTLRAAQAAFQTGIQRVESERRLQFLAQSYGEVAAAQEAAARTGKMFGLSVTESNQQFAQLYGRLRPLNVSLSDIEAAFIGFNTSAKTSGTTAAETAGAMLQLTQALGSGVLRGQELNSVLEQAPGLVVALTKELGAPITQIRKLAEQGQITSDVVIRALKRAGTDGAGQLEAAMSGPQQAVKDLQNEFENFQVAATEDLIPALVRGLRVLERVLRGLGPVIKGLAGLAEAVLNPIADVLGAPKTNPADRVLSGTLYNDPPSPGGGRVRSEGQANALTKKLLGKTVGDDKASRAARAAAKQKAEEAAQRASAAEDLRMAIDISSLNQKYSDLELNTYKELTLAKKQGNDLEVLRLETVLESYSIYKQEENLRLNKSMPTAVKINELLMLENDRRRLAFDYALKVEEAEKNLLTVYDERIVKINSLADGYGKNLSLNTTLTAEQEKQKSLADGIASSIGQGMGSAFDSLIEGAESFNTSLRKIASGVLVDIAKQLMRVYVINQAVGFIGSMLGPKTGGFMSGVTFNPAAFNGPSFMPARAMGGPVTAGQSYLVGERGPELFVPSRGGTVLPNGAGGAGAVTVNVSVDATGSQVQGDNEQSAQLGRVIAAAVQAELIKAKRPGGILA